MIRLRKLEHSEKVIHGKLSGRKTAALRGDCRAKKSLGEFGGTSPEMD